MLNLSKYSFKALILDCDGTIADTMPLHYLSWVYTFNKNKAHFPFSKQDLMSMAGIGLHDTIDYLNKKHADFLDPIAVAADKERYFIEHLDQIGVIAAIGEVISTYEGKLPMAVASGGYRTTVIKTLDQIGLTSKFEAIVTQDDVKNSKPAPDLFLLAAEKLKVDPTDCIVFEDSDLGIQAAKTAGMSWIKIESRL
jgi:beta-phosphoglucomutase-like phosphatase (HAD superfamily)